MGLPVSPVEVGLYAGREDAVISTKTHAGEDGLSSVWDNGDRIAVWAVAGDQTVLSAKPFSLYGPDGARAFFTATLQDAMPEGSYTYYATYPEPVSASGLTATFRVPSIQDGQSGAGEDILVSAPAVSGPLSPINWQNYAHQELQLSMNHLLHRFRFYCMDQTSLEGEPIQRLVVNFPQAVAGDISVDLASGSISSFSGDVSTLTLSPATPVELSSGESRHYLTASLVPASFSAGESMNVSLYTQTKVARAAIPLKGRAFAAGHSTAVRIIPDSVSPIYRLYFNLRSNNLGEDIRSIKLTAPSGSKWGDELSNVYVYAPGEDISVGQSFMLEFEDQSAFLSLSGKSVTVTYDSEHVTIEETLSIPTLSSVTSASLSLNVPWLLKEDFSGVSTFSSNDEYSSKFIIGSKDAYSFLGGWTGGRIGASAGKCIRIACRRETSADYHARVDSAPLRGTLKKKANLEVSFNYGANNKYSSAWVLGNGDVGQTFYVGYVTATTAYKSGDTDGTFESGNSQYVKEYTGSYTSTPNEARYTIHGAPAGGVFRLTIRTEVEHKAGTHNTTAWLYIDNVTIKIQQ